MKLTQFVATLCIFTIGLCASNSSLAQSVVVVSGDTMSAIAERELGNASKWVELCAINKMSLNDCDLLQVGETIRLSVSDEASSQDAVVAHSDLQPTEPEPVATELAEPPEVATSNASAENDSTKVGLAVNAKSSADISELLTNPSFDDGLSGWHGGQEVHVKKSAENGVLELKRDGTGIDGSARQSVPVEVGARYLLVVEVESGKPAYLVENSDRAYLGLDVGLNEVVVTPTAPEVALVFWPFDVGTTTKIRSISFKKTE